MHQFNQESKVFVTKEPSWYTSLSRTPSEVCYSTQVQNGCVVCVH